MSHNPFNPFNYSVHRFENLNNFTSCFGNTETTHIQPITTLILLNSYNNPNPFILAGYNQLQVIFPGLSILLHHYPIKCLYITRCN